MKTVFLSIALVVCVSVVVHGRPQNSQYSARWDHVNVDQILKSDRLLLNYFKCFMDRGSCTADASEAKRTIPDALATDCSKCTKIQQQGAEKVIRYLYKNKPDWWKELEAKYDPKGMYRARHGKLLETL